MPNILELFNQRTVIDYTNNRTYPTLLGESLFPARKVESLEFDILRAGPKTPVIASVHAFDTESEIGSREASKSAQELGFIKRKMQLKEKDLIALRNPRTAEEQAYLEQQVYNDIDSLVNGVDARVELMRMDVLANGRVSIDENGMSFNVDYGVPAEHKKELTGAELWSDAGADPIANLQEWASTLDTTPTRMLTSSTVATALLRSPAIKDMFKTTGMLPTRGNLNALLESFGLPTIATYDAKYRKQKKDGSYEKSRYFPENKIVMFGDDMLGESIYGPTPEESRYFASVATKDQKVGNVFTTVYESGLDPVGTWLKACATAMPSFAEAENVFQASVLAPSV